MRRLLVVIALLFVVLIVGCKKEANPFLKSNHQDPHPQTTNTPVPVPEPSTILLLGIGLLGVGISMKDRFK